MSSDPISPDDRPDVVAEAERLLEVPHGLVETAALARLVPALLADLKAQRERVRELEAALSEALEAAEQDGLHGGDSHDDECPVCGLIFNAHDALWDATADWKDRP